MVLDAIALAKKVQLQLERYQEKQQFANIAKLITYSLEVLPQQYNRQIFGYIPGLFRQVNINNCAIALNDIYIGEPIVYKLYYPNSYQLYNLPYFYIFCYLKQNSPQLNVYFQSANPQYKKLTCEEYDLSQKTINFEGCISAFKTNNISTISISDPGQFIPGITSSYYVGSPQLDFNQTIAKVLEKICFLAKISLQQTMLFGSSAGSFGALLSSTYFSNKTNVLAVNSQINLQYRRELMQSLLDLSDPNELLKQYGNRISFFHRFKQNLVTVPNIYLLVNVNDRLHQRNFKFYQLLISKFSQPGINHQFVFDSYYGIEGHGRPEVNSLKAKIRIAREVLTMQSN